MKQIFVVVCMLALFSVSTGFSQRSNDNTKKRNLLLNVGSGTSTINSLASLVNTTLLTPSSLLAFSLGNNTQAVLQAVGAKLVFTSMALATAAAIAGLIVGVSTGPSLLGRDDSDDYEQDNTARSMKSGFSWRDLNVLDWIAMFEEMYRKYDRFNPECHQRILCEFHETSRFHGVARRLDTVADYTGIFRNLGISLNEGLQELLDNLVDAIDKGRKGENSCGYYFGSCEFSLKDMSQKYLDPVNSNDVLESDQEFEDL